MNPQGLQSHEIRMKRFLLEEDIAILHLREARLLSRECQVP